MKRILSMVVFVAFMVSLIATVSVAGETIMTGREEFVVVEGKVEAKEISANDSSYQTGTLSIGSYSTPNEFDFRASLEMSAIKNAINNYVALAETKEAGVADAIKAMKVTGEFVLEATYPTSGITIPAEVKSGTNMANFFIKDETGAYVAYSEATGIFVESAARVEAITNDKLTIKVAIKPDVTVQDLLDNPSSLNDICFVCEDAVVIAFGNYSIGATISGNTIIGDGDNVNNENDLGVINYLFVQDGKETAIEPVVVSLYEITGTSGGGSSSSVVVPDKVVEEKEDGTTIVTETNKATGTVTETTTKPDGSEKVVETKKDGTVTTTEKDTEGNKVETVEKKDGTVTETTTKVDGSEKVVETKSDGTVTTNAKDKEGTVTESVKVADGTTTSTVTKVDGVKAEAVTNTEGKTTATVTVPEKVEKTEIVIPVENATAGTVAVIVEEDGTKTIIKESFNTEDGMSVPLDKSANIEFVDNAIDFVDTPGHWAESQIDFVSSREIFNGVSATHFVPEGNMTRAMIMTVIANLEGADVTPDEGEPWYHKAVDWAVENGVSDGTNPEETITREQFVTMLWRYIGEHEVEGDHHLDKFDDKHHVSEYAVDAMHWAVVHGLIEGMGDGRVAPLEHALRAQAAKIMMRFVLIK